MKKNFIYGMLVALGVAAFASCTTDDTADAVKKPAYDGPVKTIKIVAAIDQTRTELGEGHTLLWAEGDSFGILAAEGTKVISNIKSDAYDSSKENNEYEIEVPASTDHIYCYYPYDEANDSLDDISKFTINIPSTYSNDSRYSSYGHNDENWAGEFLAQYHFMVADSEVTDSESLVFAAFTPVVSILEFNIYDTTESGEKLTTLYFSAGGKINGEFSVDFDSKSLTAKSAEDGLTFLFTDETALTLKNEKSLGSKIYAVVPKGEYTGASLSVATVDRSFDPMGTGYFENLEWENSIDLSADGKTINIDLKHALPAPLAEPKGFTQVEGNPFFATVPVTVQPACDFFAVSVIETSAYESRKNDRNADTGKNQYDEAVDQLYDAYVTEWIGKNNPSKIGNYDYAPSLFYPFLGYNDESITDFVSGPRTLMITEDWQLMYNGYWNTVTHKWDRPGHKAVLEPNKEYTFVAYAKASPAYTAKYPEGDYVYETKFRTPALEFNGTGKIELDYSQAGATATVKVNGTNIKKIATWVARPNEEKPSESITANDLIKALNGRTDCYFADYTEGMTLTQTGMDPGQQYYFCAVGVDNDGKLVAAKPLIAAAADVEFNSDKYTLTDVKLASQPTGFGSSELTFTFANGQAPAYLRIYSMAASNVDGEPANAEQKIEERKALSWEYLQNNLRSTSGDYVAVKVDGNEVTYKVNLPGDDKGSVDISGSEDVEIPSEGNNPFYILIVGADNEGDLTTELGAIYQITGKYDEPKFTKLTDNIIRGVAENDSSHTRTNTDAYYYSCPSSEFGEPEPEPEPEIDYWASDAVINIWLTVGTKDLSVYKNSYGTGISEAWLFKLATGVDTSLFSYSGLTNLQAQYSAQAMALFSEYSDENQQPNSSESVLKHYTSLGTSYTADEAKYTDETMAVGDLYVVIARDANNKLCGRFEGILDVSGSGFKGYAGPVK